MTERKAVCWMRNDVMRMMSMKMAVRLAAAKMIPNMIR